MRYCLCHVFHRGMFGMWYRHKTTTPLYSYVVIIFVWVSHGWHFFVTLYGWWVIWYPSGHVLCVVLVTLAGMAIHVFPIFGWLTCGRLATLFFCWGDSLPWGTLVLYVSLYVFTYRSIVVFIWVCQVWIVAVASCGMWVPCMAIWGPMVLLPYMASKYFLL